jgi:hypothetical protein
MAGGGEFRRQMPPDCPGAEHADAHLQAILPLCIIATAGFLNEFPLVNETNPALISLGGTGKAGLSPNLLIYI